MAEKTKVTRITASDDAPKKSAKATASKTTKETKVSTKVKSSKAKAVKAVQVSADTESKSKNIFVIIGRYFKGAWVELRQVRWPNRKATWALTIAVILYSAFFLGLITLLDVFFKWIFELIIT